jgi:hypothetical protein
MYKIEHIRLGNELLCNVFRERNQNKIRIETDSIVVCFR